MSLVGYRERVSNSDIVNGSSVRESHLRGVPCNSADSLPSHVVQRQALLLGLHIPDSHEAGAATSHQDVCDLLIPVQAFDIICASSSRAESEGILDVV